MNDNIKTVAEGCVDSLIDNINDGKPCVGVYVDYDTNTIYGMSLGFNTKGKGDMKTCIKSMTYTKDVIDGFHPDFHECVYQYITEKLGVNPHIDAIPDYDGRILDKVMDCLVAEISDLS